MKYDVKVFLNEIHITTFFGVEANSLPEAIDNVRENLEIDFDVDEYDEHE